MTVFLIIIGAIALLLIIIYLSTKRKPQNKNELQGLINKMQQEIFPNGYKDIEEGKKELLRFLNHSIEDKTAESIFRKSSSICYTTSMRNEFSKERLKQHLKPYALHYFNDESLNSFYDYLLSKNTRANDFDKLLKASRDYSESLSPTGTGSDEMPKGYGEFGLEITNPIPTSSVPDSYFYLSKLRTNDGSEITYKRIGSMEAPNIDQIIDGYVLYLNNKEITKIFICPYNKRTSTKAPKGFKLA